VYKINHFQYMFPCIKQGPLLISLGFFTGTDAVNGRRSSCRWHKAGRSLARCFCLRRRLVSCPEASSSTAFPLLDGAERWYNSPLSYSAGPAQLSTAAVGATSERSVMTTSTIDIRILMTCDRRCYRREMQPSNWIHGH